MAVLAGHLSTIQQVCIHIYMYVYANICKDTYETAGTAMTIYVGLGLMFAT